MLAIKNYGHYWSRELVNWGWRGQGNQGELLGTNTPSDPDSTVDFRDQIGIYCLFNDDREVVYLGQTGSGRQRLLTRLRQHTRYAIRDRWTNFSWFGFLEADPELQALKNDENLDRELKGTYSGALDEIEAVLIQIVEPLLNKQGPRWGKGDEKSVEYFQYVEEEPASNTALYYELVELKEKVDRLLGTNKSDL